MDMFIGNYHLPLLLGGDLNTCLNREYKKTII